MIALLMSAGCAWAQVDVTGLVNVAGTPAKGKARNSGNVVVWLAPLDPPAAGAAPLPERPRLVQHNKSFEPHILVVPVGTKVEFPNHDPFFHNVFSLFDGKRFDLGLYEAGTSRDVLFDKPGVSYIFCNIHAEMSAVVIALTTPYYAISNPKGQVEIPHVPPGKYTLHVWYETAPPEALAALTHEVIVEPSATNLGTLRVPVQATVATHKNMYGKDYPPPAPGDPPYAKP
jgi:hypothetical protein